MGELTRALKSGDLIGIKDVLSINPQDGAVTSWPMLFDVTRDIECEGYWYPGFPLHPPMIETGPYRNVSNAPRIGAQLL